MTTEGTDMKRKKPARRPAPRKSARVRNPAARGTGTIARAVKKIESQVSEYESQKTADAAVKALILVVPLKSNLAEYKRTIKAHLMREYGEGEKKMVNEMVAKGRPGVYVRAAEVVESPNYLFEADLCLINGGRYGGSTHGNEVLYLRSPDLVLSRASAIDGNTEQFPVAKVADAIIKAYAFGEEDRGRGPWIEPPGKRNRY